MSQPGFILLAHEQFDRVAQLARFLALFGPVVIHLDRRVSASVLPELGQRVTVISTRKCEWGMMGLVEATLDATKILLDQHQVGHVCLLSGTCLPVRPVQDLVDFLMAHSDTDFIESFPAEHASWVQGGLSIERFTLWFPFGWRRRRRLFDRFVEWQRKLGISRRIPDGLEPRLGLQWWCLTAQTLQTILTHPNLRAWRRGFRWNWIPDECFFQTLVPHVAQGQVQGLPLTLQRFDNTGRPFVFHNDHAPMLAESGYFFARKIDPDADALYAHFLSDVRQSRRSKEFLNQIDETPFHAARDQLWYDGIGCLNAARVVQETAPNRVETVQKYAVVVSKDSTAMRLVRQQYSGPKLRFHGRLFGVFPADLAPDFSERDGLSLGCMPTEPVQRDYRPAQYLARLLWIGRERPAAFLFNPDDDRHICGQILSDPNARLILIGDAADLLNQLHEPLRTRAGAPIYQPWHRAWTNVVELGQDDTTQCALQALESDWDDPMIWSPPPVHS